VYTKIPSAFFFEASTLQPELFRQFRILVILPAGIRSETNSSQLSEGKTQRKLQQRIFLAVFLQNKIWESPKKLVN